MYRVYTYCEPFVLGHLYLLYYERKLITFCSICLRRSTSDSGPCPPAPAPPPWPNTPPRAAAAPGSALRATPRAFPGAASEDALPEEARPTDDDAAPPPTPCDEGAVWSITVPVVCRPRAPPIVPTAPTGPTDPTEPTEPVDPDPTAATFTPRPPTTPTPGRPGALCIPCIPPCILLACCCCPCEKCPTGDMPWLDGESWPNIGTFPPELDPPLRPLCRPSPLLPPPPPEKSPPPPPPRRSKNAFSSTRDCCWVVCGCCGCCDGCVCCGHPAPPAMPATPATPGLTALPPVAPFMFWRPMLPCCAMPPWAPADPASAAGMAAAARCCGAPQFGQNLASGGGGGD